MELCVINVVDPQVSDISIKYNKTLKTSFTKFQKIKKIQTVNREPNKVRYNNIAIILPKYK